MSTFTKPAAAGGGIRWADLAGSLRLIDVRSYRESIRTSYGETDAVEADIHVIDPAGESHPDALIFPRILVSQTRPKEGQLVLGRLTQGVAKPGQSAPWMLDHPTDADTRLAEEWVKKQRRPISAAGTAPF